VRSARPKLFGWHSGELRCLDFGFTDVLHEDVIFRILNVEPNGNPALLINVFQIGVVPVKRTLTVLERPVEQTLLDVDDIPLLLGEEDSPQLVANELAHLSHGVK
tara:strand:+ start:5947 stop:6261 length:315 start_codon:yes stop_codon:yes gene_type:complete